VACRSDAGCVASEICWEGACQYAGLCEEDADCPGDRTCDAESAVCLPEPGCAGDRFDGGDGPQELAARTYTGLLLCDGTEDAYRVTAEPNEGLRVILWHDPAEGDLSLTLGDADGLLAASDTRAGVEAVGVDAWLVARELDVVVRGRAGASVPYELTVERLPLDACVPDALEGLLGNDTSERAAPLPVGESPVKLCPGDEDWLALDLAAASRWTVRAVPLEAADDLELTLLDPDLQPLAQASEGGGAWEASSDLARGGRHLVHLRRAQPGGPVDLVLTVIVEPAPDARERACAAPAELLPDLPATLPEAVPIHRLEVGCGLGETGDHVLRFSLAAPSTATVELTGAAFGSALSVRRSCGDAGSEVACVVDDEFLLEDLTLADLPLGPGAWFVVVKTGQGGRRPRVLLTVAGPCQEDVDCPGEEVCGGGVCRPPCVDDEDCTGAQTCDGTGHCQEPAVCDVDDDCLGLRVCEPDGCVLPECDEHADCPQACVDRRCEDGVPRACHDADPCLPPWTCAPLGACVLDRPCAADADCPAGAPLCQLSRGRCVACRSNAECAVAEECGEGACELVGLCDGDGDCPGTRTCGAQDLCEAAGACAGDRFDGLGEPAGLVARAYTDLLLCDGTEDAYGAAVPAGEGFSVVLRHAPEAGDLALALTVLEAGLETERLRSDGRHGVEALGIDAAPVPREVEVRVRGRAGSDVPYDLTLERVAPEACVADELEGLLGDDDGAHATPIGIGGYPHKLCPGDEDWFALELLAGSILTVRSTPEAPAPGLALTLLDPDGQHLADGVDDAGARAATVDVQAPGRHLVHVRSGDPDERARLRLEVEVEAAGDSAAEACAHARDLEAGVPLVLPAAVPVDRLVMGCGFGGGTDYVASFVLGEETTVDLEARAAGGGAALSVRRDCGDAGTEAACTADDGFSGADLGLEGVTLDAGPWYVVLETLVGGWDPELLLTVE